MRVNDYLDTVDYSDDPNYVPSAFAMEFINFIKLVNGGAGEENKTPVLHLKMLDKIATGEDNIVNMIHRGAAKTTVFGEYMFLYLACFGSLPLFGEVNLAIYVSDSIDNGVKNMRKNLEFRWENSAFLQQYVPKTKFTDIRWEFHNADGKVFIVKGYGAKTGVRGAKELGIRPQVAVLDDLVSDEDARSPTVIASIEDTVYKAIDYALHPKKRKIVWSGTPFNMKDPLYKAVESGAWAVNVYPVCEKFPCTEAEFKGSWPDRFDYNYVKKQYDKALKSGKIDTFNQELMLRIMSDEDRLIHDTDINWYTGRKKIIERKNNFNWYITTDFATSESEYSDYSVISVWAVTNAGQFFWVDGICERQLMDKNIDDLFLLVQKYKPLSVGIEISGQQGGFIPWIRSEMVTRNTFFSLAGNTPTTHGLKPTTNKMERFLVVQPWFKQGKMFFPEEWKARKVMIEAQEELQFASPSGFKSTHDDFIDTISMLGLMKIWLPAESPEAKNDGGFWEMEDQQDTGNRIGSYVV